MHTSKNLDKTAQAQKGKGKGKIDRNKYPKSTDQAEEGNELRITVRRDREVLNTLNLTCKSSTKSSVLYTALTGNKEEQQEQKPHEHDESEEKKEQKPPLLEPRLVVSVIGDVDEYIPNKLRQEFQDGIETLLKTRNLWLLTDVNDTGLAKLVHKAVERLTSKEEKRSAFVIRVRKTCNNDDTTTKAKESTSDEKTSVIEPRAAKPKSGDMCVIEFDGADDHDTSAAEFIAEFQSHICPSEKRENDFEPPKATSVTLMFGGKKLKNAWQVFKKGLPMVIVKESGGAADYIASCDSSGDISDWEAKKQFEELEIHGFKKEINDKIGAWRELVHVCVVDGEPNDRETKGLKAAVLKAAIHWHDDWSNNNNDASNMSNHRRLSQQVDLSLSLDESQTAKTHIFDKKFRRGKSQNITKEDADNMERLKRALVKNQPNFVKLFLEAKYKYCNLHKFEEKDVNDLYKDTLETDDSIVSLIKHLMKGDWCKSCKQDQQENKLEDELHFKKLREIGKVISKLVGPHYKLKGVYATPDEGGFSCRCKSRKNSHDNENSDGNENRNIENSDGNGNRDIENSDGNENRNIDIGTHLFLWAVLFNRMDIALFFWQHGGNEQKPEDGQQHTFKHPHIIMALMASTMLSKLAKRAEDGKEPDLQESLAKHAKLFEVLASDVLMECSSNDRHKTQDLLIQEHKETIWGEETTLLSAAFTGKRKHFLERIPCRVKLDAVWRGTIVWSTPSWKIFLATVLPFLIFLIKFTCNETACDAICRTMGCRCCKVTDEENETISRSKKAYRVGPTSTENTVNFISAWLYLYSAPITKYYCYTMSYMVFLGLFSLTCLTNLHPGLPSVYEWIVWAWILLFIIDEGIQIDAEAEFGSNGLQIWIHDKWNRFDGLLYFFLSPLCFVLRMTLDEQNFYHARNVFAVTLACYFFRFLQSYYAFKQIGSKVLIIFHMMKDLFKFGLVLGVFVLSYGMAITIILYPNRPLSWGIVKYVLYSPFWQIFVRDAFVDRVDGEDDVPVCSGNNPDTTIESDSPCRVDSGFGDALLVLYTMFTNVLLLNVLIAMFNSTYERIQRESNTWWHYNRYSMVQEYLDKPRLAPPLIILSYLHRLLKWMTCSCGQADGLCRCECYTDRTVLCKDFAPKKKPGKEDPDNRIDRDYDLTYFERINMEILMERHEKQNDTKKKLEELGITPKQSEREWEPGMVDDDDDDSSNEEEMQTGLTVAIYQMVRSLPDTISKKLTRELGGGKKSPPMPAGRMDKMEKRLDEVMTAIKKIEKMLLEKA